MRNAYKSGANRQKQNIFCARITTRDLIQRLLEQAVKEYIDRLFTYRNLQAVRDKVVAILDDMTGKTVTVYDDIVWHVTRKLLSDDNLAELYAYIRDNFGYINSVDKTCKAPEVTFDSLRDRLELTDTYKAAAVEWLTVVDVLRAIIPILLEWYNKQ